MTHLLWMPDTLRRWLAPAGFRVELVAGWERRGVRDDQGRSQGFPAPPLIVVGHHTATPASRPGTLPTLGILRDGRPDLSGPLCQVGLGRDGTAYVIAAGKANHAGKGAWHGVTSSARTVGIEAEHPGDGTPWPARQLAAYDLVAAALLEAINGSALSYCGHREWALPVGRKVDPRGIDLSAQRRRIGNLLAAGPRGSLKTTPTPTPAPPEDDDMKLYVYTRDGYDWGTDLVTTRPFTDQKVKGDWIALAQRLGHKVERVTLTPAEVATLVEVV